MFWSNQIVVKTPTPITVTMIRNNTQDKNKVRTDWHPEIRTHWSDPRFTWAQKKCIWKICFKSFFFPISIFDRLVCPHSSFPPRFVAGRSLHAEMMTDERSPAQVHSPLEMKIPKREALGPVWLGCYGVNSILYMLFLCILYLCIWPMGISF